MRHPFAVNLLESLFTLLVVLDSLDKFLEGDMAEMIEALQLYDRNKKLEQANGMNN